MSNHSDRDLTGARDKPLASQSTGPAPTLGMEEGTGQDLANSYGTLGDLEYRSGVE